MFAITNTLGIDIKNKNVIIFMIKVVVMNLNY
jgi:hypothetical protein